MKTKTVIIIMFGLILTFSSCYYHNWENLHPGPAVTAPCVLADTISFSKDIAPIINPGCGITDGRGTSCHGSGSGNGDYSKFNHFGVS